MRVYISGPMTGIKDFNYHAFHKVENEFNDLGIDCYNPARIEAGEGWKWKDYMRECIRNIPDCTHMYMLEGWEESKGATIECLLARKIGMKIIYEDMSQLNNKRSVGYV